MNEFNSMTVVAATEVIADFKSHSDMSVLEVQWNLDQQGISSSSKSARVRDLAQIAIRLNPQVMTEVGRMRLARALVETAILAPDSTTQASEWQKLVAGLRFDGFEIIETEVPTAGRNFWSEPAIKIKRELRRMLPDEVPETDFREATSEVEALLDRHGFNVAKGHLAQAAQNFSQGNWSSANAMIRDFYQELLDKIAEYFGCDPKASDDAKRQYLAAPESGPFFLHEYNEWENDRGKPAYVLGLWARLHPHGSHPGLSDEEDCAFRFQIILITTRVFLRRFDKRVKR